MKKIVRLSKRNKIKTASPLNKVYGKNCEGNILMYV